MASGNLLTTTLLFPLGVSDQQVSLGSAGNLIRGSMIWLDGECMRVRATPIQNVVKVQRGAFGTVGKPHANNCLVYGGDAPQFYSQNPSGVAPTFPVANPWINVANGTVWFATGDQVGAGSGARYWQLQNSTDPIGALGVRPSPVLTTPTAST